MPKSLHEQHGPNAISVLQGMMKSGVEIPDGYDVEDRGNHYIVSKDGKSMKIGLYCHKEVFKALNLFS